MGTRLGGPQGGRFLDADHHFPLLVLVVHTADTPRITQRQNLMKHFFRYHKFPTLTCLAHPFQPPLPITRVEEAGLRFRVQKDGYYTTDIEEDFHGVFSPEKLNRNLNLVLKKVGKPIAMYARRLNTHVPALDKPVGFDLMAGDWIAPYGNGVNPDVLFSGHFDKHTDGESDFTLTVSFPKAGDGIQEFALPDAEKGGGLRSPHEAPADRYQSQWVQTDNRKPGKPIETNRDPNRNYFFRVRTALDVNGNVVSAHYGKIYGDFMQFTYYLNPTPNDRNIEFDPKQNLLGGIQSFEQVTAP
jgi:hypothetical protein